MIDDAAGPDKEFTELVWVSLEKAKLMDIPSITQRVIEEATVRISGKLSLHLPVPFFRQVRNSYVRELL